MANRKVYYGKVLKDVNGYKIRQMGSTKTIKLSGNNEQTVFQSNGTVGVYAGRKKLKKDGFKSMDDAIAYAQNL